MNKLRMKGVGCSDKYGRREVIIHKGGKRHYYGAYFTLEEANARARDVWRLYKATGQLPRVVEQEGKSIGECPLAPAE